MQELFDSIIAASSSLPKGQRIGHSREGRPIIAYRFGQGACRISLIAGCHSDEPVGPRWLRHLVAYFSHLPQDSPILEAYQWWIVPHANPDGEKVNRSWYTDRDKQIDLISYLKHVKRELPGDDVEFGFPRDPADRDARPENQCIAAWWRKAESVFHLHVSLHGMAFAGGPFFLIEPAWSSRCEELKAKCRHAVDALGYRLHDVDRKGEKGFSRLETGFATRPDSKAMTQYFLDLQDEVTASKFRPVPWKRFAPWVVIPSRWSLKCRYFFSPKWVRCWVLPIQKRSDGKVVLKHGRSISDLNKVRPTL